MQPVKFAVILFFLKKLLRQSTRGGCAWVGFAVYSICRKRLFIDSQAIPPRNQARKCAPRGGASPGQTPYNTVENTAIDRPCFSPLPPSPVSVIRFRVFGVGITKALSLLTNRLDIFFLSLYFTARIYVPLPVGTTADKDRICRRFQASFPNPVRDVSPAALLSKYSQTRATTPGLRECGSCAY